MKAKQILGLIACVGACATFSAFGNTTNTWFGLGVVKIDEGEPTIQANGCTLVNNGAATYVPTGAEPQEMPGVVGLVTPYKFVLDTDSGNPLTVTPTESTAMSDGLFEIYGSAVLTPSNTNDFEVTEGAKAGFAVGIAEGANSSLETNFYGYANGEWYKLSGQSADHDWAAITGFKFAFDYREPNVRFYIGYDVQAVASGNWTLLVDATNSNHDAFAIASGTTSITGVDAFGSGSIKDIYGGFEVAQAACNGVKYGSLVEAIAAAGEATNSVQCIDASGNVHTGTCDNGLQAWECAALGIDPAETLKFEPASADKMDSQKIVLKAELDYMTVKTTPGYETYTGPDPDFNVAYDVYQGETRIDGGYSADAVKIPMGTGSYTVKPVITPKQ